MSVLSPRSSSLAPRRAFTLIEMLISMAITLLMMAAVVNLFANIGAGVRIRRATMEMSGELRMMRATLFNDLAGATCKTIPWARPDEDQGYLEIVEGRWEDTNPTGLNLNLKTSLIPGSQAIDPNRITDASGLGDYDDVLAFTARRDSSPFSGRAPSGTVESSLAEVVWFCVENPPSGALGEPGMRTVYRRVLLIAPWLPPISANPADSNAFFQAYDISAHYDSTINAWVPNTLGDLSKRENRAYRTGNSSAYPFPLASGGTGYGSPSVQVIRGTGDGATGNATVTATAQNGSVGGYTVVTGGQYSQVPSIVVNGGTLPATARPVMQPLSGSTNWTIAHVTSGPAPLAFDRQGEDVMLSNVLAFDVRVFDPGAPLFSYSNAIIEPVNDKIFYPAVATGTIVGFGAYVDLGWDNDSLGSLNNIPDYDYAAPRFNYASPQQPYFQQARMVGWNPNNPTNLRGNPCAYDTWSFHYENDGLDQDGDGLIDEGTNGLDDDGVNGVDDIGERETSPPYPVPLRGMQVVLRIYEPETRQIREATVTRNSVEP